MARIYHLINDLDFLKDELTDVQRKEIIEIVLPEHRGYRTTEDKLSDLRQILEP